MYGKFGLHLFMLFHCMVLCVCVCVSLLIEMASLPVYIYIFLQSVKAIHTHIYPAVTLTGNPQSSQLNLGIAGTDDLQTLPFTEDISNG